MLRQRLPVYPEYIKDRREYLPPELAERIQSCADSDGLVPCDDEVKLMTEDGQTDNCPSAIRFC